MKTAEKRRGFDSSGDLSSVYKQYRTELRGFIARRVDSPEEAEDILHDVFYKLSSAELIENPIEYLSAWLYRAAMNRIIDRRRKKREQALPEIRDGEDDDYFLASLSDFLCDDGSDPETMLRSELIRDEIAGALSELPAEQRSVFELTEYDGIPYREISESTGVPVATLLSRKHYAVSYLRKRLYRLYTDLTER